MKADMKKNEDWGQDDYASSIHSYFLEREKRCPQFQQQSPQLQYRKYLVDYLDLVCTKLQFCTSVKHLAVYIMDIFMDCHVVQVEHLQLVAVCSLIVAVKVDEQDVLIPKISEFRTLVGSTYELRDFVNMEIMIMEFLNWDLMFPTPATFAEYYSLYAVASTDYHSGFPLPCLKKATEYVKKYISYFLDVSLQECVFHRFLPSKVAASCVAASRMCLMLTPTWPTYLKDLTQYSLVDLSPCLELMLKILDSDERASKKTLNGSGSDADGEDSSCEVSDTSSCTSSPERSSLERGALR